MMMGFGLIVLVIVVAAGLYLTGREPRQLISAPGSALDILKARYARGEISRAEYEEMRQELS